MHISGMLVGRTIAFLCKNFPAGPIVRRGHTLILSEMEIQFRLPQPIYFTTSGIEGEAE
jgi:hypothetical protein